MADEGKDGKDQGKDGKGGRDEAMRNLEGEFRDVELADRRDRERSRSASKASKRSKTSDGNDKRKQSAEDHDATMAPTTPTKHAEEVKEEKEQEPPAGKKKGKKKKKREPYDGTPQQMDGTKTPNRVRFEQLGKLETLDDDPATATQKCLTQLNGLKDSGTRLEKEVAELRKLTAYNSEHIRNIERDICERILVIGGLPTSTHPEEKEAMVYEFLSGVVSASRDITDVKYEPRTRLVKATMRNDTIARLTMKRLRDVGAAQHPFGDNTYIQIGQAASDRDATRPFKACIGTLIEKCQIEKESLVKQWGPVMTVGDRGTGEIYAQCAIEGTRYIITVKSDLLEQVRNGYEEIWCTNFGVEGPEDPRSMENFPYSIRIVPTDFIASIWDEMEDRKSKGKGKGFGGGGNKGKGDKGAGSSSSKGKGKGDRMWGGRGGKGGMGGMGGMNGMSSRDMNFDDDGYGKNWWGNERATQSQWRPSWGGSRGFGRSSFGQW